MRPSRCAARCACSSGSGCGSPCTTSAPATPRSRQLAALPIDTIKVERRFVAALGTEDATSPIAQAVIATGSALGLRVIGAGAESREQVEHLRRLGCTDVQGFLFSEPVSASRDQRDARRRRRLKRTVK